ncbi:MAG: NAD-dependent dihydropyrimidine dehydrogenase subunit PreA [Spirochaetota bacterium]|nr:NAD-dependent dihydropyrimidine dehydrogenase subunit PreA [Spirochaetota bacterium]
MAKHTDLSIDFLGFKCENPFFLSSSPVSGTYEMCAKFLDAGGGGVFYKTLTTTIPEECSPRFDVPRKEATPFISFKNMEQTSDKPYQDNLDAMKKLKENYPNKLIIGSIMGMDEDNWEEMARDYTALGIDMLELNFSCPQMTYEGMGSDVGASVELIDKYVRAARRGSHLPLIAKMTPNIEKMEVPAIAAINAGAQAISTINTIKAITGMDFDHYTALPVVNGKSSVSGLSGKATKPIALRFITNMAQDPQLKDIPLSGIGGIETWEDAAEFIMAGASNVQFTTSVMQYGYRIVEDMISGLSIYLAEKGFDKLEDFVGIALKNIIPADDIERDFKILPKIDYDKCVNCGRCYISCYDAAHQAIEWDNENRKPTIDEEKCVGCQLCLQVCPVYDCITPGRILFKEENQFGKGSKTIWKEDAVNKHDVAVGKYDRP